LIGWANDCYFVIAQLSDFDGLFVCD